MSSGSFTPGGMIPIAYPYRIFLRPYPLDRHTVSRLESNQRKVCAHDAVDRKAIDSPRAMTLQRHATPEVIEKPEFVSPAPGDFDPFAHWAATLDGAVKKRNLSTGEPRSWI